MKHSKCNGIRVVDAGPSARPETASSLTVLAVFDRSIYLRGNGDVLLCLSGTDLPVGPYSLRCERFSGAECPSAVNGAAVANDGHGLSFPCGLRLVYDGADRWRAGEPVSVNEADIENALQRIDRFAASRSGRSIFDRGFGSFIPTLRKGGSIAMEAAGFDRELHHIGSRAFASLDRWLTEGDRDCLSRAVESLIGLGPGLTPSGDDMLAGLMFGLHLLGERDALNAVRREVQALAGGTNFISRAYLQAAGLGQVSSSLHEAALAICVDAPDLEQSIGALAFVGHSSGLDALSGLLPVFANRLRRVAGRRKNAPPFQAYPRYQFHHPYQ